MKTSTNVALNFSLFVNAFASLYIYWIRSAEKHGVGVYRMENENSFLFWAAAFINYFVWAERKTLRLNEANRNNRICLTETRQTFIMSIVNQLHDTWICFSLFILSWITIAFYFPFSLLIFHISVHNNKSFSEFSVIATQFTQLKWNKIKQRFCNNLNELFIV